MRRLLRLPPSRERVDREVRDEIAFHVETRVHDLIQRGMDPAEARSRALREFGDPDEARLELTSLARERWERNRRREWWRDLGQDLRIGARGFGRRPGWALAAGGTIALGIAAVVSLLTVVRFILLEPLPYPDPNRLITIWERSEQGREIAVAAPNAFDWREQNRTLEGMAIYQASVATVLGGAQATRAVVARVSEDFLGVFRLTPALGRLLTSADFLPGAPPVAIVSDRFWRDHLGGDPIPDPPILELGGVHWTVVGVLPPGYHFPDDADLWLPVNLASVVPGASRTGHNWRIIGRVRAGETVAAAQADLDRIQGAIRREYGVESDAVGVILRSLREEITGPVRELLLLLLGAAGVVLLVACTNVASMVLAQGTARRMEFAVRASLGAGRGRLIRQLFAESVMLAGAGAAAGVLIAAVVMQSIVSLAPVLQVPRLAEVRLDGWTVGFALLVAIGSATLFGLLPALRITGKHSGHSLRVGGGGGGGRSRQWGALVAAEVALATMLAVGAGLLWRSFRELVAVPSGVDASGVVVLEATLPESRYGTDPDLVRTHRELQAELQTVAGVAETGLVTHLPQSGWGLNGRLEIASQPGGGYADYRVADAGFFRVFRIPVRRGRLFAETDDAAAPPVAVINETMAERYWPDRDPVGEQIRNLANDAFHYGAEEWLTIVGVVGDIKDRSLAEPTDPTVYVAAAQRPLRTRFGAVVARVTGVPADHLPALRTRLEARFPDLPIRYQTMEERLAAGLAQRRFTLLLFGVFATTALALAMLGVYGVVSYRVGQRTREIGIRIALGATLAQVRWLVVGSSLVAVLVGLGAGLIGARLGGRLLAGLLYGVPATDHITYLAVPVVLAGAAIVASLMPARRAARVDPLVAIRSE